MGWDLLSPGDRIREDFERELPCFATGKAEISQERY